VFYGQHEAVPFTRTGRLVWRSRTLSARAGVPRQMAFAYRFVHARGGGNMRLVHLPGGSTQMDFRYHVTRFSKDARLQVIRAATRWR
jgi:hypothetical protein